MESYFQHTKSTFSSITRQSMKRRVIAKHVTEPKEPEVDRKPRERKMARIIGHVGSVRCLAIIDKKIVDFTSCIKFLVPVCHVTTSTWFKAVPKVLKNFLI